jgi:DNA-binding SARP family transcriptional activator/tetratricopeptide (TPR) repeat protein
MEFRLLGPVEVWEKSELVPLGGAKPRILLAMLLLHHGQIVPTARLVDGIWGDEPPATAKALVQTYVAGLRRTLAAGPSDLIGTRSPGYLLRTDPENVDRWIFEQLTLQGREAAERGHHDQAGELYSSALALWRGPALSGIDSPLLASEAAQLDELHLTVLEERIGVDLLRRRHEELVPELTALVGRNPTRETLRRHLMVALYRSQRQADALAVYREGRQLLIDELGVEPGPALRAVHEAVLRGDDAVLAPAANPPTPTQAAPTATQSAPPVVPAAPPADHIEAPPSRVPAQLPPVPADFTGRDEQVEELLRRLAPLSSPNGLPTVVVAGKGGVGKTTLAARVAHELATAYPDGQLFVQLHGMTPTPTTPDSILDRFLTALGDPPAELPTTLEGRVERYRSLVAGRRILVVLDDAADERQVRPLLPGSPSCAVLITSRSRLAGLAAAQLVEIDVLNADEAGRLLALIAGPQRVRAEADAAARLIELCGRLPLAVRIVGTRLANRRHWSVHQLNVRLTDEQRRLNELRVGDQEVRASISLSYQALDEQARTALRRLGLLGLPDFPPWIVAALLDVEEDDGEQVIERLVDSHFIDLTSIDAVGQPRYYLHNLLSLYAAERAQVEDEAAARDAAVRRVLRGWLRLVDQTSAGYRSGGILLRGPASPSAYPAPEVAGAVREDPRAWFQVEQHGLIASVERAAAMDLDDVAADLASALCGSLYSIGNLFDAWTRTHDVALATVRRAGNRHAEASLLAELGQLRYEQDRHAEARTYFLQALVVFREVGDVHGEAATLAAIGTACREQGYLPEALHFLEQADALLNDLNDEATTAYIKRLIGSVHLERGDFGAAHQDLEVALTVFRRIGSRRGEAMTLRTIGLVHRARGEYRRAYDLSSQSRAIFADLGDELLEAYSVRAMGKAQIRLGETGKALAPLQDALLICRTFGDRWGEAMTLRTLGELHLADGQLAEAGECLHAALRLWQALDLPLGKARTLRDLARLAGLGDDPERANRLYAEAVEIFRLYGAHEYAELVDTTP